MCQTQTQILTLLQRKLPNNVAYIGPRPKRKKGSIEPSKPASSNSSHSASCSNAANAKQLVDMLFASYNLTMAEPPLPDIDMSTQVSSSTVTPPAAATVVEEVLQHVVLDTPPASTQPEISTPSEVTPALLRVTEEHTTVEAENSVPIPSQNSRSEESLPIIESTPTPSRPSHDMYSADDDRPEHPPDCPYWR